ncbi:hypothetical protein TIFTF001_010862 [Ficus carica]|uniref:Uncharacterized protein n=1 Tax=Ficus carica TaxID=3494 RepID=A0AA87ZW61_FICCA|nr:hypothetical protein TIFTF001_010862 [Ficus carica]
MESKKLKSSDILKESLTLFSNNFNFIICTALTSLPLFFFSLYFETSLQTFHFQASELVFRQKDETPEIEFLQPVFNGTPKVVLRYYPRYDNSVWSLPLEIIRKLNKDVSHQLLHLGFLYLVPFHLLELVTVLVIVDSASKIHREGKSLTFNDVFDKKPDIARVGGILVTFGYVVLLSTCTMFGFVWLLITYASALRYYDFDIVLIIRAYSRGSDVFFHLVYGANLLLLLGMYLVWSAIWNLGLVISVLKAGTYGAKALGSSAYLSLRNFHNGVFLMLVFSIWGVGLRLPCLFFGCYKTWGWIVAQSSLFCLGNAIKWVSFVVYFNDCLKRIFGKKVDAEEGKDLRGQSSL